MLRRLLLPLLLLVTCLVGPSTAHEVRPGYLQLTQTGAQTCDVLWKVPAKGGGLRLGLYVRFPDGTQETSEHVGRFVDQAYVDRWSVEHPEGLAGQVVHIDGLRATLTDVIVRVEWLDGTTFVGRMNAAEPGLVLAASPGLGDVASTYLTLGVEHILLGIDHLLFVFALLMIVRGARRLVATITAFTLAHSVTLAAATLGWVAVPIAPVEAVIALSIVFVACEIVHGRQGRPGLTARSPWIVALVFGLLHGFGFAGALHEVGLPDHAIPTALLFFNVGVELGQLLFVAATLALVALGRSLLARAPAWLEAVPAYAIGALAMFWVFERVAGF